MRRKSRPARQEPAGPRRRPAPTRIPGGHPEGYLEAFATIYTEAAAAIRALRRKGGKVPKGALFPTVQDGLDGMRFIDACVKSSKANGRWTKL